MNHAACTWQNVEHFVPRYSVMFVSIYVLVLKKIWNSLSCLWGCLLFWMKWMNSLVHKELLYISRYYSKFAITRPKKNLSVDVAVVLVFTNSFLAVYWQVFAVCVFSVTMDQGPWCYRGPQRGMDLSCVVLNVSRIVTVSKPVILRNYKTCNYRLE